MTIHLLSYTKSYAKGIRIFFHRIIPHFFLPLLQDLFISPIANSMTSWNVKFYVSNKRFNAPQIRYLIVILIVFHRLPYFSWHIYQRKILVRILFSLLFASGL